MRCKSITKDFGLPKKQFSNEVRCSRCCIEWSNETKVKVNRLKTLADDFDYLHFLYTSLIMWPYKLLPCYFYLIWVVIENDDCSS